MNEPHHWPDMADEVDKPEDELAELMLALAVPREHLARMIEVVHEAGRRGILERMDIGVDDTHSAKRLVKRILGLLGCLDDPRQIKLRVWCLDFITGGNAFNGQSQTSAAVNLGFTRANISAMVTKLKRKLHFENTPGCKSTAAIAKYRERAKRNHSEGKGKGAKQKETGSPYLDHFKQNPIWTKT